MDFCSGSMVGSNARSPAAGEAEKVSEWHFHLCSEEEVLWGCMSYRQPRAPAIFPWCLGLQVADQGH